MVAKKFILQNPRNYTVQIRNSENDLILGTGIIVSEDGLILTCAHVIATASVDMMKHKIIVYFPQIDEENEKEKVATIIAYSPESKDDLALLKLIEKPPKISSEHVAKIGSGTMSSFHSFRSYGYRPLGEYIASYATGEILGPIEKTEQSETNERLQIRSSHIDRGMSGAGVLDIERNLVVGVLSETWRANKKNNDEGISFAIDLQVLKYSPFNLDLYDRPYLSFKHLPKLPDIQGFRQPSQKTSQLYFQGEPSEIQEWSGREEIIDQLFEDWESPQCAVTSLIGFGGEGKTSIARHWVELVVKDKKLIQKVNGVFWWNFYSNSSSEEFLLQVFNYFNGMGIIKGKNVSKQVQLHFIASMLMEKKYLFVLDGFEVMQYQGGDKYGLIKDEELRVLVELIASLEGESFLLITSRAPILDLVEYSTYNHIDVRPLSNFEGVSLLRALGVRGRDSELESMIEKWNGHALTLSLLGTLLAEKNDGLVDKSIVDITNGFGNEVHSSRVNRILSRYDAYLSEKEKTFLVIMSDNFRAPIGTTQLSRIFSKKISLLHVELGDVTPKSIPTSVELKNILSNLTNYRILRLDSNAKYYTLHPLVRAYYLNQWAKYLYSNGRGEYWQLVSRCQGANLVIFAIEKSWSMAIAGGMERVSALISALVNDIWQDDVRVGAVSIMKNFAEISLSPTNDIERIETIIEGKVFQNIGGKTPLAIGLLTALSLIQREVKRDSQVKPLLIFITDGASNVALEDSEFRKTLEPKVQAIITTNKSPQEQAYAAARLYKSFGIPSIVIDTEHRAFDQGFCENYAKEMGGSRFEIRRLVEGWYLPITVFDWYGKRKDKGKRRKDGVGMG